MKNEKDFLIDRAALGDIWSMHLLHEQEQLSTVEAEHHALLTDLRTRHILGKNEHPVDVSAYRHSLWDSD